ncbi:hypothetical protein OG782_37070 [Streptomyces sp. NBC_00876]|uniref:hypothetical protein n=1 Tax=Streptomyces sp. NBC_00876 TaxID=2975853 RepID=UPI003866439F|nr:hypothetical protein OG782_37070 [Streptomyces sp. NBC_00876]
MQMPSIAPKWEMTRASIRTVCFPAGHPVEFDLVPELQDGSVGGIRSWAQQTEHRRPMGNTLIQA